MVVDFEGWTVRARALGQSHPYSNRSFRYVNAVVERERRHQPADELGIWAGQAINAGYCLRRVEEQDTDRLPARDAAAGLPDSLDAAATHVAQLLRTEGADPFLLSKEEELVAALDHLIAGEIERRLGKWGEADDVDADAWTQLEEYLAWWTIKGYALRVVDQLLPDDVAEEPGSEPESGAR